MVREITSEKIDTIVSEFPNLIKNFENWWYDEGGGPSLYFYQKTISKVRNNDLETLLGDKNFTELLYATLMAWDMDSRGASLKDFKDFRENINKNKKAVLELSEYELTEMENEELDMIKDFLRSLYSKLDVMKTSCRLVSNSKLLHFTLPSLIMPMDRANTLKYFYENRGESKKRFIEIFDASWKIARRVGLEKYLDDEFNLSKPKVIDNAINAKMRD